MAYGLPQITVALVRTIKMIKYFPTQKKSARKKIARRAQPLFLATSFRVTHDGLSELILVVYSMSEIKPLDRIDCKVSTKGCAKLDMLCFNSVLSFYYGIINTQ